MLKRASYVCLIALLVASGVRFGYEKGLATVQLDQPAATAAPIATALIRNADAPSFALESSPQIALFRVAEVAHHPMDVILFTTGSAPVRPEEGKFNFNIGYQF